MALGTPTLVTKGADPSNLGAAPPYVTASASFVTGVDYFLAFSAGRGGATPDSPTVSGTTSGTWASIDGNIFNPAASAQRSRIGVRRFRAASDFSEAISISFTNACDGLLWILFSVSGCHATTPVLQTKNGRGDAATTAECTALAAMTAGGLFVAAFSSDTASNVFTAGGTCTLLDQTSRTDIAHTLCVVYNAADENPSATMAAADWGGGSFELQPAAAGGFNAGYAQGSNILLL